jgi:2-keto-3-deoxy-L-fuconate dehydrogenase
MGDFDGLRALVTGAATGLGLASARYLAARGAAVAVLDRVDKGPDGFVYVRADVSDDTQVQAAVRSAVDQLGGLDILVNNAGVGATGGIADNDDAEWQRVMDVNVLGLVRVTRAALPALRRSKHAAIVNTGSICATIGLPQRVLYGASKGAIMAMSLAMAADLISEGIRVNVVNPGTADTEWVARLLGSADDPDAERAGLMARQPHGRLVDPEEVAAAVGYLASPLAGSTNGAALAVDGGSATLLLRSGQ